MNQVPALTGTLLIVLALVDMLTTVLTTRGGGLLTSRLGEAAWWFARQVARKVGRKVLTLAGPMIAVGTMVTWIALLWTGWLLIFTSEHANLVNATTGVPADFWARLYFTGYTLFTLGLGDYRPDGAAWQVLTTLAVGNGFLVMSLGASYMVPLVSAATSTRSTALYIKSLGSTPTEIVENAWDGKGFSGLNQHLTTLTPMITQSGQQHLAYPVLHYFQSEERGASLPLQLAVLQEAVLILQGGVASELRLPPAVTRPLLQSIARFSRTIGTDPLRTEDNEPPMPEIAQITTPKGSPDEFASVLRDHTDDRRRAAKMVRGVNWDWAAVVTPGAP